MRRNRRGHMLLEAIFAVFLAFCCAAVVFATIPVANTSRARADQMNKAVNLAMKQMEAVRSLGYANLTVDQLFVHGLVDSTAPINTNTFAFTNVDSGTRDSASTNLPNGTASIRIDQVDLDLRRVTVQVSWDDRGGARTYRISTLVANL